MSGNLRSLEPQKVRGLINAGVQQAAHDRMPPQVPWSATERPSVDVPTGGRGVPHSEPLTPGPTTPDSSDGEPQQPAVSQ